MPAPEPYIQEIPEEGYLRAVARGRSRYEWTITAKTGNRGGKRMSGREEMDNILGSVAEVAVATYLRSKWTGDFLVRDWGPKPPDVTTPAGQPVEVRSSQNPDALLKSHDHEAPDLPVVLVHVLPDVRRATIIGWLPAGVIHQKGIKKAQPDGKSHYYLVRQSDLRDIRSLRPWLAERLAKKREAV